jgi:hypothetical protein
MKQEARRVLSAMAAAALAVPLFVAVEATGSEPPRLENQLVGVFTWRAYGYVDSEPAMVWDSVHRQFLTWGGHLLDVGHEPSDDVWAFSAEESRWVIQPQINAPRANCCANQTAFDTCLASDGAGNLLCVYEKEVGPRIAICARTIASK